MEYELEKYFETEIEEEENISRVTKEGKHILTVINQHDLDHGGNFVEVTGSQGSGKTSAMLGLMSYTMQHHSEEKVFWSSSYDAPLQFIKIGQNKKEIFERCNFLVLKDSGVTFHDRLDDGNHVKDIKPIYFEIKEKDDIMDFSDLYDKAEPGKVNAVFFGDRYLWMDYIHWLRRVYDWIHIYIDEFGEVCPSDQAGKMYKRIRDFAETAKEVRKCNMNVFINTQSATDIDYRVRKKLMIKIFLPGSKADAQSRVKQRAIDNLQRDKERGNQAYIDIGGVFGRIRFSQIFKPNMHISWEARKDVKVQNNN